MAQVKRRVLVVLVCVVALATAPAAVQRPQRLRVYLDYSGHDSGGTRTVSFVKERLSASARYVLSESAADADLSVLVASLDISCVGTGNASALSVVLVDGTKQYMESWVYRVGSDRVRELADTLVADVDKELASWTFKK